MIPFRLHRAGDIDDAFRAAASCSDARWVAGGTTLVDLLKLGVENPGLVIDINALGFADVVEMPDGGVSIGALARMSDVANDPVLATRFPLVTEALLRGASPQLRNMATIGGNLLQRTRCPYFRDVTWACNKRQPGSGCAALEAPLHSHAVLGNTQRCIAVHPSDLAVSLVAVGASVRTARRGERGRSIRVEDLYVAYGEDPARENVLEPGELITAVEIPALSWAPNSCYVKMRGRASYEFALASAAVMLDLDGQLVRQARIALGGLAGKPWRSPAAEHALVGRMADRDAFRAAADAAMADATPSGETAFKVELGRRTLVRALTLALERA